MFNLMDSAERSLQKPGRIASLSARLRSPLGRRCDGQHAHGVTHGQDAVATERFTDEMAKAIGKAYVRAAGDAEDVSATNVPPGCAHHDGPGKSNSAEHEPLSSAENAITFPLLARVGHPGDDGGDAPTEEEVHARRAHSRLRWALDATNNDDHNHDVDAGRPFLHPFLDRLNGCDDDSDKEWATELYHVFGDQAMRDADPFLRRGEDVASSLWTPTPRARSTSSVQVAPAPPMERGEEDHEGQEAVPAQEESETDENDEPGPEVRVPVAPRLPKQPTAEEAMRHRITHLPFAAWCADCVSARAKDDPHTRQAPTHVPTVQVDYSFLGTSEATDKTATLVIANLAGVGYGFADVVVCKGTMDTVLGRNFTTWLKEIGHGSGDIIIQSDPEPAIKVVAEAFGKLRRQLEPGRKRSWSEPARGRAATAREPWRGLRSPSAGWRARWLWQSSASGSRSSRPRRRSFRGWSATASSCTTCARLVPAASPRRK